MVFLDRVSPRTCNRPIPFRKVSARSGGRYCCLYSYFLAFLLFLNCVSAFAGGYVNDERFFSYERFFLNRGVLEKIPAGGEVRRDLNRFVVTFTDGLYAISTGRLEEAKRSLLKAREIWPEYFGVDFLLALIYEKYGDYRTAARYYKSYLNKLRSFHAGGQRISGPLIRSFTSTDIESYDIARSLVEERLAGYGISLNRVRPTFTFPDFLLPFFLVAAAAGLYGAVYYWLWPCLKRQYRIKNPPEGFWICRHCDRANPELDRECEKCGRPRE